MKSPAHAVRGLLHRRKGRASREAGTRAEWDGLPWSRGYGAHKQALLEQVLTDPTMMAAFREGRPLPTGYGRRMDERVVEYPWVFAHLSGRGGPVLDAGSTLNKPFLIDRPELARRQLLICTLEADWITLSPRVSYLFGDLRDMLLRDASVQSVVCISTLEHIGFPYDYRIYSRLHRSPQAEPDSYVHALDEFRRVLRPGGDLLLTLPYGRYEDHGWLQQFDAARVERVKRHFGGRVVTETYYRYADDGWQTAKPAECRSLTYYNVHEGRGFDPDHAAAARAVVCLHLAR